MSTRAPSGGWLWLAAFSTLFCCLPMGWIALALALEARRLEAAGSAASAASTSRVAGITAGATVLLGAAQ